MRRSSTVKLPKRRKSGRTRRGRISESEGGRDKPLVWGAPYQRKNLQPDFINDNAAWRLGSDKEQRPDQSGMSAPQDAPILNPAGAIFAGSDQAGTIKPTPNGAAAIKALFTAAKEMLSPSGEDAPQPRRRRRGETDKGFIAACRSIFRRARIVEAKAMSFIEVCASAGVFLTDMQDPLSHCQNNETIEQGWQDEASNGTFWEHFPEP